MIFTEGRLKGVYILSLERIVDHRGFFARAFVHNEFEACGLNTTWIQANIVGSRKKGTIRGLHYQIAPHEEIKLIQCVRGAIFDVIIDLRHQSPTYKQWLGIDLTADNKKMLYIPHGFAHGYQAVTDDTEVFYLASRYYAPDYERGVRWNDPGFHIQWPEMKTTIVSTKDMHWPDYVA